MRRDILSNVKIAIVDHDSLTRNFIVNVMMYSVNREILSFENAAGLKAYLDAGGKLDLVMAEIHLPDGSGLNLLEAVKKEHPDTVLVAFSANASDAQRASQRKIDSFLAKPFTLNDLFAIVQHFVVEDTA